MNTQFDITNPEHAYLFGFLQADGHMSKSSRNRGKICIELKVGDRAILESFQGLFLEHSTISQRTRDTNFQKEYTSVAWTLYNQELRGVLNLLGLPYGRKSDNVAPPAHPFSIPDYFRGLVDGDGSLGLTGQGYPFLSFTTKSSELASAFLVLIEDVTGKVKTNRPNTRDKVYNLCVFKEDAQALASYLYYPGSLSLARKREQAQKVADWIRPSTMVKVTWQRKRWSPAEDAIVLSLPTHEAMAKLRRSEKSVLIRLCRLRQARSDLEYDRLRRG
jgi:hypothetical protein